MALAAFPAVGKFVRDWRDIQGKAVNWGMRITHLGLKNFRGFEQADIQFPERFSVIIGDNGTGKTAVLEGLAKAIGAFLLGFDGLPSRTIIKEDIRLRTIGLDQEPQLPCVVYAKAQFDGREEIAWWRAINRITKKTTADTRYAKQAIALASQMQESVRAGVPVKLPVFAFHGTARLWTEFTESLDIGSLRSRIGSGYKTALDGKSSTREFRVWFRDMLFNAATLRSQEELTLVQLLKDAITEMVPGWEQVDYDLAGKDIVGWRDTVNGKEKIPFSLLSDGYRNMVGMVADIAYRCIRLNPHLGADAIKEAEGVILIDEIDLHLHPNWQRSVVGDLKRIFPKLQFVATTHSPFIVQSLENAELIDLNGKEMDAPYWKKSIEEIAEGEMGVFEVQRSEEWQKRMLEAEALFERINAASSIKEVAEIQGELDIIQEKYHSDPAYIALLRAEHGYRQRQIGRE